MNQFIADKLLSDVVNGVRVIHGDGDNLVLPSESEDFRGAHPYNPPQGNTD